MSTNYFISLITAVFIGGAAGYVGSLMATKNVFGRRCLEPYRFAGNRTRLALRRQCFFGSVSVMILGILLIWWLSLKTELSMESLVGVVFVLSLAIGFLITPRGGIIA